MKFNYNNPPVEFLSICPPYLLKVYADNKIFGKDISSETKPYECMNLYQLIINMKLYKTLEIGLAQGFSAAWMCKAHVDAGKGSHTSIDPFQKEQWHSTGIKLIEKCGYSSIFNCILAKSYEVLPIIKDKYNLIYIDGFHTFDYTLIDFFYSDLLLEIGGFIIIDDATLLPVKKCVDYISENYRHYKGVNSIETQAVFQKISEDIRPHEKSGWKYHRKF